MPLPAPPPLFARLDALLLSGADAARVERELAQEPELAAAVAALRAIDAGAGPRPASARELRDLAVAAAWLELLRRSGDPHAAGRASAQALLAARLGARIARRAPRPLTVSDSELFCLPPALALSRARLDERLGGAERAAREAAALARSWGLSGAAVELLAESARPPRPGRDEAHLLDLAGRLAGQDAEAPRGTLGQAALDRPARALGLRPAELAELCDFAASARAASSATPARAG
jgi:hypothetical protein